MNIASRLRRLEAHRKPAEDPAQAAALREELQERFERTWEQAEPEHRERMSLIFLSLLAKSNGQERALEIMKQSCPDIPEQELRENLERAIREYPREEERRAGWMPR